MDDLTLGPLRPAQNSATDQVFDVLYDAIISVKLPPGTKVSEAEFAKHLNVSRQPVRDAFFRLSTLGFLSIRPQRATLITQISQRAVIDAVFTRTALEVECLTTAMAHNAPTLITGLTENLNQQAQTPKFSAADFHALDEAFHEIICHASGHGHVWSLIRERKAHLDRIRFLTLSAARQQHVITEHRDILDAIKSGEVVLAETLLRDHIGAVTDVLPVLKDQYPTYFDTAK
ncbi:MAG: GntR family transcriptional regulator [Octadecabacter sp.]